MPPEIGVKEVIEMKKVTCFGHLAVFAFPLVMVSLLFLASANVAIAKDDGDACSKKYAPDAIAVLIKFAKGLSADSAKRFEETFKKCDVKVNDQMLDLLDAMRVKADEDEDSENKDKMVLLNQQRDKEFQIEVLAVQKPLNEAELKKVVTELFDINQKIKKADLDAAAKDMETYKKTIEDREKNKARIIERKIESLKTPDPLDWE